MSKVVEMKRWNRPKLEETLADFLNLQRALGKAERTVTDYRKILSHFFKLYPEAYSETFKTRSSVLSFMASAKTPTTHNLRLSNLRVFFCWAMEEGIFPSDPTEGLKKRKNPGKFVEVDIGILKKLLSLPDKKTFAGYRDYALMIFTLDTGIRPGEALSLKEEDFNLSSLEVRIPPAVAKTRISRTLPLSPPTGKVIRKLLAARHPQWRKDAPVFSTFEGTRMSSDWWGKRINRYSKKLPSKVTPYMLRHSFATLFLRNGGNAVALQRIMGHSTMQMTERYVHLVEGDIREQHSLGSPLTVIADSKDRRRKIGKNSPNRHCI